MAVWTLGYDDYDPQQEGLREALSTVGNGYFATRGASPFARADGVHYPGTYVAGLYDRLSTTIDGHEVSNEDLVNLPNWLPLTFRVAPEGQPGPAGEPDQESDGEAGWNDGWFTLTDVDILEYRHAIDLRTGLLTRRVRFIDQHGRRFTLVYRQFVSMAARHVGALEMTLVAENWSGQVQVRSALDGQVTNSGVARYRALRGDHLVPIDAAAIDDTTMLVQVETRQSHIRVAEAARTRLSLDDISVDGDRSVVTAQGLVISDYSVRVGQGQQLRVEKVATLFTSRDQAISESAEQAVRRLEVAGDFDALLTDHRLGWDRVWDAHQLRIRNDEHTQMVLNLHIFHLVQTVSINSIDLDVGVPARGLHGEAYRGHIFWDELFIFPYLNLRLPELTRALLRYRYRRLPAARQLAREAGHVGATYPWQSGSDGRETSQTWHLNPRSGRWTRDNSHLQRHINFAVAYNIWQYGQITGDTEFLAFYGCEMLVEIARFLADIATYNHALDRYEIRGVMGPDEYHEGYPWRDEPGVDNNTYTNVMTVWTLLRAMDVLEMLPRRRHHELITRLRLQKDELLRWADISRKMRICFLAGEGGSPRGPRDRDPRSSDDGGILSQFEGYERLEEFDWDGFRAEHGDVARLDRILEAEDDSPNRYKVSKQADVLMLFYLFTDDEIRDLLDRLGYACDTGMISRTIDYYLQRTAHGSTLSAVVHSWVLARRNRKRSFELFRQALESDVSDIQGGTTPEGIHLGAMAGTVDMVQRGYTGLQPRGDVLWLDPVLPDEFDRLEFTVRYRTAWDVRFDIDHERIRVDTPAGSTIKVGYGGHVIDVPPGSSVQIALSHASRR